MDRTDGLVNLFLSAFPMSRQRSFFYFLLLSLSLILIALGVAWLVTETLARREPSLEFSVLDVGQGDAILIETPAGQNVLIDAGEGELVIRRLSEELAWWDRHIDLLVLTHPHSDHFGGMIPLFARYEVGTVLHNGLSVEGADYEAWSKALATEGSEIRIIEQAQTISLGGDCSLSLIYPRTEADLSELTDLNESSLVSRLDCLGASFLLMGDAGKETEHKLLESGIGLRSDVLKVGHHGSAGSSDTEFLAAVDADWALLSLGADNRFGHPSPKTERALAGSGAAILRTDQSGTLTFVKKDKEKLYLK
jgi:competence protein ComEC